MTKDDVIRAQEWAGLALFRETERLRAEVEQLRALMTAAVECPLLANACEHTRAMSEALEKHHWPDLVPGDGPCERERG